MNIAVLFTDGRGLSPEAWLACQALQCFLEEHTVRGPISIEHLLKGMADNPHNCQTVASNPGSDALATFWGIDPVEKYSFDTADAPDLCLVFDVPNRVPEWLQNLRLKIGQHCPNCRIICVFSDPGADDESTTNLTMDAINTQYSDVVAINIHYPCDWPITLCRAQYALPLELPPDHCSEFSRFCRWLRSHLTSGKQAAAVA